MVGDEKRHISASLPLTAYPVILVQEGGRATAAVWAGMERKPLTLTRFLISYPPAHSEELYRINKFLSYVIGILPTKLQKCPYEFIVICASCNNSTACEWIFMKFGIQHLK